MLEIVIWESDTNSIFLGRVLWHGQPEEIATIPMPYWRGVARRVADTRRAVQVGRTHCFWAPVEQAQP